jgi:hypothetical protein
MQCNGHILHLNLKVLPVFNNIFVSTNFECGEGKLVRLEYIFNSCTAKFSEKFSKDVCSKAVQTLFGVEPRIIYEKGQRIKVYKNLNEIINTAKGQEDNSSLCIPDHCTAYVGQ